MSEQFKPIAVSYAEVKDYGCPYCGDKAPSQRLTAGGGAIFRCLSCKQEFVGLLDQITISPLPVNRIYPALESHPFHPPVEHMIPEADR